MSYLWTSEAVSSGHPDKVADQIADAVLDAYLKDDAEARVACEVTLTKDLVLVTGEITSKATPDIEAIVRKTICDIGYDGPDKHYDGSTVEILNKINKQSEQIASAVSHDNGELGAGDQGLMFGYACGETKNYMPLAHALSFEFINLLEDDRRRNPNSPFLPDAKTQATIEYDDDGIATRLDTMVISTCHKPSWKLEDIREYIKVNFIEDFFNNNRWADEDTKFLINPAGAWTIGGPAADTGLSGRKIVVDNYGADCPIGGGSFSGKDPTKVDRSAAYAARYIAKNIVAAKLAKKARVQLSYAIGMAEPVSVRIETFGTANTEYVTPLHSKDYRSKDQILTDAVRHYMDLTPKGIITRFDLRRPIYQATASGGHFGRKGFPWENTDLFDKENPFGNFFPS